MSAGEVRPVWLLDVDGVLNADRAGWSGPPRSATVHVDGHGLRVRWSPQLIARVRALVTAGLVEVRWCSTWCPFADVLERAWGLPPLGRAWTGDRAEVREVKIAAAVQVLAEGRRLVWTDDDLDDLCPGAWAGAAQALRPYREGDDLHRPPGGLYVDEQLLLIRPESRWGLRPADMDRIEAFVRGGGRG